MTYQTLTYEVKENIGWIYLNRVEDGNALNENMAIELMDVAWECEHDEHVRVVVITAKGKSFSYGGDLTSFSDHNDDTSKHLKNVTVSLHEAVIRFSNMKKPIIAGVNGVAAGAGMSIAMLGDLVIASDAAKFTLAYTNVGLTPDGSASYFLPRIVGAKRALDLTLTNRVLTANEAQDWGLVSQIVPHDDFIIEIDKLAKQLASGPVNAYGEAKILMNTSFDQTLETQLAKESTSISKRIDTKEGQEGIQAFLEKRKADFLNLDEK